MSSPTCRRLHRHRASCFASSPYPPAIRVLSERLRLVWTLAPEPTERVLCVVLVVEWLRRLCA
jgi:hypothetical protein